MFSTFCASAKEETVKRKKNKNCFKGMICKEIEKFVPGLHFAFYVGNPGKLKIYLPGKNFPVIFAGINES